MNVKRMGNVPGLAFGFAAVIAGLIMGAVLYGAMSLLALHSRSAEAWMVFPDQLLRALSGFAPGMTAGYVARASGFVVGGTTGALVSLGASVFLVHIAPDEPDHMVLTAIAWALAGFVTNGVGGIAGVTLARRPS